MGRRIPTPRYLQKSAERTDSREFVEYSCDAKSAKNAEEIEDERVTEEKKSNRETPRAQRSRGGTVF